jgi:hypothetical protein
MTRPFAQGKKALGICDRCGFTYRLVELKEQIEDARLTGLLVCDECLDEDQPQLQLGKIPINDPQALQNPRPDRVEPYVFYAGIPQTPWDYNYQIQGLGSVGFVSISLGV